MASISGADCPWKEYPLFKNIFGYRRYLLGVSISFIADEIYEFEEPTYRVLESEKIPVTIRREGSTDEVGSVGMYHYQRFSAGNSCKRFKIMICFGLVYVKSAWALERIGTSPSNIIKSSLKIVLDPVFSVLTHGN